MRLSVLGHCILANFIGDLTIGSKSRVTSVDPILIIDFVKFDLSFKAHLSKAAVSDQVCDRATQ